MLIAQDEIETSDRSSSPTMEHRRRRSFDIAGKRSPNHPSSSPSSFTNKYCIDLDTIKSLDQEYERALVLREIGWNARYLSVRQNASLSTYLMISFLIVGLIFFQMNTNWSLSESLLFSVYTITTVGVSASYLVICCYCEFYITILTRCLQISKQYGQHEVPQVPHVQLFISIYILVGIAMLTILAAQLYQWVVLEITWIQYERDSERLIKQKKQSIKIQHDLELAMNISEHDQLSQASSQETLEKYIEHNTKLSHRCFDLFVKLLNMVQNYTKDNPAGQLLVVMVAFSFVILLGAITVGSIEGWNLMESIYFSVVSMTTVGFGDYYPEKLASTWFCIIWLPFSVGFISLYLGSVANWYIDVSGRNISKIESRLRRRVQLAREEQEQERAEVLDRVNTGGFDLGLVGFDSSNGEDGSYTFISSVSPSHLNQKGRRHLGRKGFDAVDSHENRDDFFESRGTGSRRQDVLINSGLFKYHDSNASQFNSNDHESSHSNVDISSKRPDISTKDIILEVKRNLASPRRSQNHMQDPIEGGENMSDILSLKSTKHYTTARGMEKKPTFALRILVLERFSRIIAHEIAGYQSRVEIKNNTLSVTIDSLKLTADKWFIPKRARKSFRAVAFEILYFVGERNLIVYGADAVFSLNIHEVQGLFAPVLAALGDADTMETWLQQTHQMAHNELRGPADQLSLKLVMVKDRHEKQISQNLTANPKLTRNVIGNAVNNAIKS